MAWLVLIQHFPDAAATCVIDTDTFKLPQVLKNLGQSADRAAKNHGSRPRQACAFAGLRSCGPVYRNPLNTAETPI